jgi:protein LTV1
MVFTEKANPNRDKIKHRSDLEEEFNASVRDNEGEAANYGVYFDDSTYDYMQHLRDIGMGNEAYFVEAPSKQKAKGKGKLKLEDVLKDLDLQSEAGAASVASSNVSLAESLLPDEMLPSEFVQKISYQSQQDVPDDIAGFQPDMDPRLREVLEALEDDAYVDDDEEIFETLAHTGEEVDPTQWEYQDWEGEEDEGWESDRTVKADEDNEQPKSKVELRDPVGEESESIEHPNEDWLAEFTKFKKESKSKSKAPLQALPPDLQSVQTGATSISGLKRKKRKGALTASTGYSMTSSVLARTEGQSILDQRFDRLQEEYADDEFEDSTSMMSGFSGLSKLSSASQEPTGVRSDFDSIMDDFLGSYTEVGQRRVRKGRPQTGLEQLEDIRKTLGPARVGRKLQSPLSAPTI